MNPRRIAAAILGAKRAGICAINPACEALARAEPDKESRIQLVTQCTRLDALVVFENFGLIKTEEEARKGNHEAVSCGGNARYTSLYVDEYFEETNGVAGEVVVARVGERVSNRTEAAFMKEQCLDIAEARALDPDTLFLVVRFMCLPEKLKQSCHDSTVFSDTWLESEGLDPYHAAAFEHAAVVALNRGRGSLLRDARDLSSYLNERQLRILRKHTRRICDVCSKRVPFTEPHFQLCDGCGERRFCGVECQRFDWLDGGHSRECRRDDLPD